MAREIREIKEEMTALFVLNEDVKALYGLDETKSFEEQFSTVSIESILFYTVSFGIWILEQLFLQHKNEIDTLVSAKEPHRAAWYRQKALAFQLGCALSADADYYDNAGRTDEEIEKAKVVKYAVAVEECDKSTLYIKVAGENRQPLPDEQAKAFEAYINEVADVGVHITVVNSPADQMYLEFDIYYDASVLATDGSRLDGTGDTTVQDAVRAYLANLEFNAQFVSMRLVDAVQKVEGVKIVELKSAKYKYKELSWQEVNARYTPYAGYMTISNSNLKINWIRE